MTGPFRCNYCGAPSWVHPQDQRPPPSYCHESDHGEPDEFPSLAQPRTDEAATAFRGLRDQVLYRHVSEIRIAFERFTGRQLAGLNPREMLAAMLSAGHGLTTRQHPDGREEVFINGRLAVTFGPVVLAPNGDGSVSVTRRVKHERTNP